MPTDTLLVSIGVCIAFLVFAFAVAWADHSTTQWLRRRAAEEKAECKADEVGQRAA